MDTARLLITHHSCHADGIAYLPGEPGGVIAIENVRFFNTFRPGRISAKLGAIEPFIEYMCHLVPDDGDRHELLRWCATLIARPGIRMHYGVLLISETQGVGKSTLGEAILAPLLGVDNVSFPTEQTILRSDFNDWIAHKRLAIIQEIFSGQNKKVYDILKSWITDRYVEVKKKFISDYRVNCFLHILACSNKRVAIHLDDEDRRWFVPKVTEVQRTRAYWAEFNEWLQTGGLGIIRRWANEFVEKEKPVQTGDRAPMTTAKSEMIFECRSPGQQMMYDLAGAIADGGRVVLAVEDVRQWVAVKRSLTISDQRLERSTTLRKALVHAGLHLMRRESGTRFKVGGQMTEVVGNFESDPVASWSDLSMYWKRADDIEPL